jgi:hypothetical protein
MLQLIQQALANLTADEKAELATLLGQRGFSLLVKAFGDELGQIMPKGQSPTMPMEMPTPQQGGTMPPPGMPQPAGIDPNALAQMLMQG